MSWSLPYPVSPPARHPGDQDYSLVKRRSLSRPSRGTVRLTAASAAPSSPVILLLPALLLLQLLSARGPCAASEAATVVKDARLGVTTTMSAPTGDVNPGFGLEIPLVRTVGDAAGRGTGSSGEMVRGAESIRSPRRTEWEDCSHEPAVEVRDVFMAPDPPVIGHPFELQLPAVARQMIAGGEVAVTIKFHGLPIHVEYTDICQQTACPVLPGSFTFQYWRNVPSLAFPGPYYARLMATDRNSTELFCIIVTLKVRSACALPCAAGKRPACAAALLPAPYQRRSCAASAACAGFAATPQLLLPPLPCCRGYCCYSRCCQPPQQPLLVPLPPLLLPLQPLLVQLQPRWCSYSPCCRRYSPCCCQLLLHALLLLSAAAAAELAAAASAPAAAPELLLLSLLQLLQLHALLMLLSTAAAALHAAATAACSAAASTAAQSCCCC
ncbi:unnamed protein product [Closterium sp. NIES-54]